MSKDTTLSENGKRRGKELLEKYGREHFAELGRKSVAKQRQEHGDDIFSERGKKGAAARAKKDPRYLEKMRAKRWGKKLPEPSMLERILGDE